MGQPLATMKPSQNPFITAHVAQCPTGFASATKSNGNDTRHAIESPLYAQWGALPSPSRHMGTILVLIGNNSTCRPGPLSIKV